MIIKTRLLVIAIVFGLLPIVAMLIAGDQTGLSLHREFYNTIAIVLMVTILAGLLSPGIIRQWLFANQIQKMKEFCQQVKIGHYDVVLTVPNERGNDGDENELVDLMRDMNWMVHRIKVNELELRQSVIDLAQSKAEIQAQKKALEEVNAAQLLIQGQLQGRTQELKAAVDKLRNLMDNAGQGFLSFGEDLKVAGEYSAECVMIFNQEIRNEFIPALLYPHDTEQQAFLTALLGKVFQEDDAFLRDNYLSLLPEELELAGSYVQITYKLIHHPVDLARREILLILTDVTQKRKMEEKIQAERDILSLVVRAVTHQQEFTKAKVDYKVFCRQELPELLSSQAAETGKISEIFRTVHTWKGTFAQLGLQRVAAKLHELESALSKLRDGTEGNLAPTAIMACFVDYQPDILYDWLEQELEQLRKVLGSQFLSQDETIVVESCKLHQLEDKIRRLLTPCQARPLIEDLRHLRYKPFSDLINIFPEYIADLALRQGKEISSLSITGARTLVDPEKYHDFAKVLVHVFRNAVAHGLETPDERLEAGKQTQGQIRCHIEEHGANLLITIADDGRGIDGNVIRRLAIAKGVCSERTTADLTEEEVIQLIFADGFSSVASANELSGRGVGLAAVKQELEKLGGHIEIMTMVGKGTKFTFVLPLINSEYRMSIKEAEQGNGACISCG
ncbi:ATP-binding protein [Sporomusa sp. KB1]|uniref:ATP-binding protein n=1 Tax=Sporomusa sp. KB1 TaxID=943346 RepID=UPI0011A789B9|nr:ATP-binding protein [Sporomusa sp. KB1]TWH46172.1 two-component system chemotaxis sensor kinase CheA [Sporomusa sp. KB1]